MEETNSPVFLTKSAAGLYAALSGRAGPGRWGNLTRRRVLGLAGGGLAVTLGEPVLEGLSAGLRYGRWGARLDGMLEADDVPPAPGPSGHAARGDADA